MTRTDVCARYAVEPLPPAAGTKLGISGSALEGRQPVNGLRHAPVGDTNGWYVWAGDYPADPDFFQPLHVKHVADHLPRLIPYLELPPGWRFVIADEYEDVWEDQSLLGEEGRADGIAP